ncbi:MAG TPA: hypothetical protein PLM14_16065 [Candidatus Hydrogenedentes bacterium]|nr:hypothetical protein [Candidatus Hydrogenedentota bacterium]HQE84517.1 hypothetical protein [Candidatus Hydrogenedentota bacterium]HQH54192.1 hypothetical protein [Candidatus Hydrogenedentota bacterium]HQM48120.1 hypothetical protein [Candidatus Hydrogenedentota bacterium]
MKARKKSEWKMAIREEAKRKVRGPHCDVSTRGDYSRQVEAGLRELRTKMSEAGDGKAKRIKSELTYLLNNYAPRYDARIEQLIDDWRRSGDPEYDPGIRIKHRKASQIHMRDSGRL